MFYMRLAAVIFSLLIFGCATPLPKNMVNANSAKNNQQNMNEDSADCVIQGLKRFGSALEVPGNWQVNCLGVKGWSEVDDEIKKVEKIKFANGAVYSGQMKGRLANGFGSAEDPDGSKYTGNWANGLPEGFGVKTRPGDEYSGYWKNGFPNGKGKWTSKAGESYDGEWLGGKRNGQGISISANGFKYVGEFKDDKRNEQGVAIFVDGAKYIGEFRDDKQNGRGTLTLANGNKFVGDFIDDRLNGYGLYTFGNGDRYMGEFVKNQFNGQGVFTFADGRRHLHEWKDHKANGLGIRYKTDGSIESSGIYANNQLVTTQVVDPSLFVNVLQPSSTAALHDASQRNQKELEERAREKDRLQVQQLEVERKRREEAEERLLAAQLQRPSAPVQQILSAHALVIGNSAYPGTGKLENPVNDSRAISAKLRALGFKVTEVEDANRAKLVTSLAQFSRSAASADLSVLFYSGHGVQLLGSNYILPTDIDQSDLAQATIQGISLDSVISQFLPGKTKLVFLDACRDNPLYQLSANKSVSKGLAPISVSEGTLIAYATKDGQVASDGGKGALNSPFTVALLEHLSDPDDIAVVLRRVREKVKLATGGKQVPWDYGSLTGGALVLSAIKTGEAKK
jgi:hypothetical protein